MLNCIEGIKWEGVGIERKRERRWRKVYTNDSQCRAQIKILIIFFT